MPKATWNNISGSPFEDELDDYPVYDGDTPPKGVYRFVLKTLRLATNRNDEPMLKGLLILNEPNGSKKAQYNGYDCWFNLNVTNQGAKWVNNFLSALVPEAKVAAIRKAFWGQKVMIDKGEPPNVLSIGGVKMPDGGAGTILVSAKCGHKSYNGDIDLDPKQFFRPTDTTLGDDPTATGADDDENEEGWDAGDEDGLNDAPLTDDSEDEEVDEELAEREEELAELSLTALKKLAKEEHGAKVADLKNLDTDGVIDWILDREFPPDEDGDDEDADAEADEEDDEDLEDDEEDEEEPEPEPEPAPARRSRRAAATKAEPEKAAATPARRGRRAAPAKEETPAPAAGRARTGTRRRKASGEPPF